MPRLPYLRREDLAPQDQAVFDEIGRERRNVPRPFQVLLYSPGATRLVAALGEHVRFRSQVPPALNELAILTVGRHYGCQYEFTAHAALARTAGVREEAIQTIAQGKAPAGLNDEEALVVRFAQEIVRDRKFTDATWNQAVKRFGNKGATDLAVAVGYYGMMCHFLLSFEVTVDPGQKAELPGGR